MLNNIVNEKLLNFNNTLLRIAVELDTDDKEAFRLRKE